MAARGILLILVLASGAVQATSQERGKYRLSHSGREAGTEEYRLEEFDDGQVVLSSKARYDVEIAGGKREHLTDTVLTMDRSFSPLLYAGYRKAGREEEQVKIQWAKGVATAARRQVRTSASFLLDSTVTAHLIPILRRVEAGKPKVKVFNPNTLGDFEIAVRDKGEAVLRGRDASVRVREFEVGLGYVTFTAHVDEKKRLLRAWSAVTGALAELEGFEGWTPEAMPPEGVEESEAAFASGTIRLAGTVVRPRAPGGVPAVVIVSDTGPHDRDGKLVRGKGGSEEFAPEDAEGSLPRALASALAGAGVLVLRYDDRGCGASGGEFATARFSDLVADAEAAVAHLRARNDATAIGVVGLGEGALVASVLAAREGLKAVFLLGAPAHSLDRILLERAEKTLREQGTKEEVLKEMMGQQRRLFDRIKGAPEDYLEIDERRTFVGWMKERFALDPRAAVAKIRIPLVVCQGAADRETPAAHAEILRQARADADLRIFEDLDHGFARASGRVDEEFLKHLVDRAARLLRSP